MKRPAVVAAAAAILATGAAGWWLDLSYSPNTGKNIHDNEASFQAYVVKLGLGSISLEDAKNRLMLAGFRCESFADGGVSCHRKVRGSKCGEQQFVDLKAPG
ncbi:MAG TPA: hypothetical protein VF460_13450, partial [Burkholderiales bacterium]